MTNTNNAYMSKPRDITFDEMKGIGIILVLLGHVWELKGLNRFIVSFHMPMFFIVAGYFSKSYNDGCDVVAMIKKYAKRLWIPYLFVMPITILWFCVIGVVKGDWNRPICELISLFWVNHQAFLRHTGQLELA